VVGRVFLKTPEELRAVCNVLEKRHSEEAARRDSSRRGAAKQTPVSGGFSALSVGHSAVIPPQIAASYPVFRNLGIASAAAVNAGFGAGSAPSERVDVRAKPEKSTLARTSSHHDEAEVAGSQRQRHGREQDAAAEAVMARARGTETKRRRLGKEDAAVAA